MQRATGCGWHYFNRRFARLAAPPPNHAWNNIYERCLPSLRASAKAAVDELPSSSGGFSLPDLSGLARLEVEGLPDKLQPWEANGRKYNGIKRAGDSGADDGSGGD